jgi:tetratricopeptide (TPR) repeat protein
MTKKTSSLRSINGLRSLKLFAGLSPFAVVLAIGVVMPACEGFVCSQERIKAIELANRGVEAFRNNLYDTAEKDLKQAIQTDPSYDVAYYNLGKVFQKQRKWDAASEAFEQAAQRAPNNANYQYDLGESYLESKKIDQAEKAFIAATNADGKLFKAWWRLGLVYKGLDRPKEADNALRKAIEANTRFAKPYVALGYLYLDYDFDKEAAQVFSQCVLAKDDDAECHNGYGMALKNLKQYDQSVKEFKTAIDLDPELFDALYNAGMTYADWYDADHANDHKDKAQDYLKKFVATGGGKEGGAGYVKAANDKLYALSGP